MKEIGQSQVLEMARITDKLSGEAKRIITGITDQKEVWERLDERYGDKKLAVIAAMRDLTRLKMPAGLPYKKVEAMIQGVRLTKTQLRAVGEEGD